MKPLTLLAHKVHRTTPDKGGYLELLVRLSTFQIGYISHFNQYFLYISTI